MISFCDNRLCYMHEIPADNKAGEITNKTEVVRDNAIIIQHRHSYVLSDGSKIHFCDNCANVLQLVNYQGKRA